MRPYKQLPEESHQLPTTSHDHPYYHLYLSKTTLCIYRLPKIQRSPTQTYCQQYKPTTTTTLLNTLPPSQLLSWKTYHITWKAPLTSPTRPTKMLNPDEIKVSVDVVSLFTIASTTETVETENSLYMERVESKDLGSFEKIAANWQKHKVHKEG